MIQVFNAVLSGLLALGAAYTERKCGWGWPRCAVFGVSFFTLACYLDSIFSLIMGSITGNGAALFLQCIGVLVSKSILAALLMLMAVVRNEPQGSFFDHTAETDGVFMPVPEASGGKHTADARGLEIDRAEQGWQYLDGLTLGIALFFLLLLFGGRWIGSVLDGEETFGTALLLCFFVTVMAAYALSIFFYRKKQAMERALAEAVARKHEADIYLEGVEAHYQQMRELWHDMKNHISLLSLLLQEEKYGQMADYLRVFGEDVDALALPMKSGNLVVDALLADKAARAKKAGVAMELELCDLTGLTLKADEICGLLGNLLDNALEANSKVEGDKRFLQVSCSRGENGCYIRVRNASAGQNDWQGGVLYSAKSDRKNRVGHGLGLRSVQRIVHSCGGELVVEDGETQFTAVVRLPVE